MVYEAPKIHEVGRAEDVVQGFIEGGIEVDGTRNIHMPGDLND